jgi:hypothetical protein
MFFSVVPNSLIAGSCVSVCKSCACDERIQGGIASCGVAWLAASGEAWRCRCVNVPSAVENNTVTAQHDCHTSRRCKAASPTPCQRSRKIDEAKRGMVLHAGLMQDSPNARALIRLKPAKYLETFFIAFGNLMENKLSFVTPEYGPLFFSRSK